MNFSLVALKLLARAIFFAVGAGVLSALLHGFLWSVAQLGKWVYGG